MLPGSSPPFLVTTYLTYRCEPLLAAKQPLAAGRCFASLAMTGRVFYLIAARVGITFLSYFCVVIRKL